MFIFFIIFLYISAIPIFVIVLRLIVNEYSKPVLHSIYLLGAESYIYVLAF